MTQNNRPAISPFTPAHQEAFIDPQRLQDRIPAHVLQQITPLSLQAFIVDSEASDTRVFCERYGYSPASCANTLILKFKKNGLEAYAAAVSTGAQRLDINGAIKQLLAAQRISFARTEKSTELTGMVPGGITVFGLPADWPLLIDNQVLRQPVLIMGGGTREVKLLVPSSVLAALPNVLTGDLALPD